MSFFWDILMEGLRGRGLLFYINQKKLKRKADILLHMEARAIPILHI